MRSRNIIPIIINGVLACILMQAACHNRPQRPVADAPQPAMPPAAGSVTDSLFNDQLLRIAGLPEPLPDTSVLELRLHLTRFPWLDGEILVLHLDEHDSTATYYRYELKPHSKHEYKVSKRMVHPRISWQRLADSLTGMDLLSQPRLAQQSNTRQADGSSCGIQFIKNGDVCVRTYQLPVDAMPGSNIAALLRFINNHVTPLPQTDAP